MPVCRDEELKAKVGHLSCAIRRFLEWAIIFQSPMSHFAEWIGQMTRLLAKKSRGSKLDGNLWKNLQYVVAQVWPIHQLSHCWQSVSLSLDKMGHRRKRVHLGEAQLEILPAQCCPPPLSDTDTSSSDSDVPLTISKDAKLKYSVIDGTAFSAIEHALGPQLLPQLEIELRI